MTIKMARTTKHSAARRISLILSAALISVITTVASAATLKDITYSSLPGNRLEVRLAFDGTPPEVKGYSIEKPARIALDLLDATSGLTSKYHNLGAGNARSITVVEAKDRTRLIVNMIQLQGYETEVQGNELVLVLGVDGNAAAQTATASGERAATGADAASLDVRTVDFRRGSQGEGQINISLSSSSIPVDVREEGGRVIARFVGAKLPKDLHRRLDVTDFATPVKFIDSRYDGQSTVMVIEAEGSWEYLAYQADNLFTINVKPVTQVEASKRKQDAFQYSGEKLSLSFQDIEVRSVLQLVADFTSLNLVASDTVSGRITLRLQNVPWDQALDLILKTKGLDKRQIGNVLLVAPADEIAAREQLELESQKKIEALAPLRTEYVRVNYARAADLEKLIKAEGSLLTRRGSIAIDERTNTLIIQDTDRKLEEIREVISYLDVAVQQVLIEARVVVASTDVAKEMGVRWGGVAYQGGRLARDGRTLVLSGRNDNIYNFGEGALDPDDDGSFTYEIERPQNAAIDFGVLNESASRFSIGMVDARAGVIDLELSALDSEGRAELVATPKVLTADQQPALIASGQQVGYQKATSSGATAVEFVNAELRLEVTPAITPEGKVIMQIKVNNDRISGFTAGGTIPLLDTNRIETAVLVGDGETVVLGGIFQENVAKATLKTPFLGDLPWIGRFFRKDVNNNTKQELLIFITPRLIKDAVAGK
ncbi:MAG: type IV pilus secretin PilQ [Alcanivoracaceae bacterium]|jgi:type IV pilus assembly protein PilQ|nr:type IV pilus secretin PilQ [Alcanivoracaceae bacterium]